jgi:hypothetical protein
MTTPDTPATPAKSKTISPVAIVLSSEAIEQLNALTLESWGKMSASAQTTMTNMMSQNGWDYRMVVGGSLMTQIIAMAVMQIND